MTARAIVIPPGVAVVLALLLAALGGSQAVTCAACPDFATAVNYGAGATPAAMAAGDLNGDGKLDLAVANATSNTISVLLGNGSGAFAAAVAYGAGASPAAVAIGDVNRDGKPDLAVANDGAGTVSILLGAGDGTFAAAVNYASGANPRSIAIGDLDRDGKPDLIVLTFGENAVSVLLGVGDGTFGAAAPRCNAGVSPKGMVVTELNGDGILDVVTGRPTANVVRRCLGDGAGSFGSAAEMGASGADAVAVGDLNADGFADIVAARASSPSNFSVLIGNGDGTFAAAANYSHGGAGSPSIAIGDANSDGAPDLVFTLGNADTLNVKIELGNGHGAFPDDGIISYTAGGAPVAAVLADFNSDGKPDIATANGTSANVSVLLNSSVCHVNCGTIVPTSNYGAGNAPRQVALGDFNRDGKPDVAVANAGANTIGILLGNGDGTLVPAANYTVGATPRSVVLADFNRDGKSDLAVANSGASSVSILIGQGNGAFATAVNHAVGPGPSSVAVGDFNLDGKPDLVTANGAGLAGSDNNVSVRLGNGDGTFAAAVHYGDGGFQAASVAVGDFNGDGSPDLVVANHALAQESYSVLMGNGDGTFAPYLIDFIDVQGPTEVRLGDLNADGKIDFALASASSVPIYLGRGDGTFQLSGDYPAFSAESVEIADINADGKLDLAVPNNFTHRRGVSIRFGNGAGGFGDPVEYDTGWVATWLAAADVNGDGTIDLAASSEAGSSVGILLNTCRSADLTVSKSHSGNVSQGQTGVPYTITVTNTGIASTSGVVTLVDTLPSGLIATGIGGTGWSCTLSSLTCTRSDALAAGASYPPVTLTVTVRSNASSPQTNAAAVSGGNELNTGNNSVTDPTGVDQGAFVGPTSLTATAVSASQVNVTWDAVHSAANYQILRSVNNAPYVLVGTATSPSFADTGLVANTTFLYQVRAIDGSGTVGPSSLTDLATTIVLTDDPLLAQATIVKAVHLAELRTAVNAVRAAAGLPAATFSDAAAAGVVVKAVHVSELRSALDEARTALGLPSIPYTDAVLPSGATIKAVHLQELRSGVK
jgi:uncharacterized repeat protein (TIGR01451 family)